MEVVRLGIKPKPVPSQPSGSQGLWHKGHLREASTSQWHILPKGFWLSLLQGESQAPSLRGTVYDPPHMRTQNIFLGTGPKLMFFEASKTGSKDMRTDMWKSLGDV